MKFTTPFAAALTLVTKKPLKHRLPLMLLLSKVLIVSLVFAAHAQAAHAQAPTQVQQQLTDCAKQLNYTPVQKLQLMHLKQQQNLSQQTRFQNYLKILTPAQQQQLAQCTKVQVRQAASH
jgi:hypothetical protein